MPEFILNNAPHWFPKTRSAEKTATWHAIKDFACGYVEAMFFTNGDTGDDDEFSLNRLGASRLTIESRRVVLEDCERFLALPMENGRTVLCNIQALQDGGSPSHGDGVPDDRRAGHMFWYSRQGHGVAWTDDYSAEDPQHDTAQALQELCRGFGECYVETYRGWIYVR